MFSRLALNVAAAGSRAARRTFVTSKGSQSSSKTASSVMLFGGALGVAAFLSASEYGSSENEIDISALSALNAEEYRKFRVRRVEIVAPDTKKILLDLPSDTVLGTWPVSTVSVKATIDGDEVEKRYAPVSPWNSVYAELVVKDQPNESNSSELDRHLSNLKEGEIVELQGPHELMRYKPNAYRTIGMIAGSTGIAPLIQVIHEAMFSAVDYTEIKLVLCNKSADDILLRDELDALQRLYPSRLSVYHVVDEAPAGWGMGTHLDEATLTEMMPSAREAREGEAIIMVSGPDDLIKDVAGESEFGGFLKKLNYKPEHIIKFPSS